LSERYLYDFARDVDSQASLDDRFVTELHVHALDAVGGRSAVLLPAVEARHDHPVWSGQCADILDRRHRVRSIADEERLAF
jgi:hypothetical protein